VPIFTQNIPGLPPWVEHHESTWCPFCYLGWARDPQAMAMGQCCSILGPQGLVDLHVPAIDFDRENPQAKILTMFYARPWEMKAVVQAGIDLRRARRIVPGLAEAFVRERSRCEGCTAWLQRGRVPCRRHGKLIDQDQANALAVS